MIRAIAATLCLSLTIASLPPDAAAALGRAVGAGEARLAPPEAPLVLPAPALPAAAVPAAERAAAFASPAAGAQAVSAQESAASAEDGAQAASAEQSRRFDHAASPEAAADAVSVAVAAPAAGVGLLGSPASAPRPAPAPAVGSAPLRRFQLRRASRAAEPFAFSFGLTSGLVGIIAALAGVAGPQAATVAALSAGGLATLVAIWPGKLSLPVKSVAAMSAFTLVLSGFGSAGTPLIWSVAPVAGALGLTGAFNVARGLRDELPEPLQRRIVEISGNEGWALLGSGRQRRAFYGRLGARSAPLSDALAAALATVAGSPSASVSERDEALQVLAARGGPAAAAALESAALADPSLSARFSETARLIRAREDLESLARPASPGAEDELAALLSRADAAAAALGAGDFAGRTRGEEIAAEARELRAAAREGRGDDASVARARLRELLSGRAAGGAALWSSGDREERAWKRARLRRRAKPYARILGIMSAPILGFGGILWALAWLDPSLAHYAEQLRTAFWLSLVAAVISPKGTKAAAISFLALLGAASGFTALEPFLHWMWPLMAPLIVLGVGVSMAERREKEDPLSWQLKTSVARDAAALAPRYRRLQLELAGAIEERHVVLGALPSDPEAARALLRALAVLATDPDEAKAEKALLIPAIAAAGTSDAAWLLRHVGGAEGAALAEGIERQLAVTAPLEAVAAEAAAPAADRDALLERAELALSVLRAGGFADNVRADEVGAAADAVRQARAQGRGDEEAQARARLRALLTDERAGGAAAWTAGGALGEELAWRLTRTARRLVVYLKPILFLGAPILGFGGLVWLFPQPFEPYVRALAFAMFAGGVGIFRSKTRRAKLLSVLVAFAGASGFLAASADLHLVWPIAAGLVMLLVAGFTRQHRLENDPVSPFLKQKLLAGAPGLAARPRRLLLDLGGTLEERHAALDALTGEPASARALLPALGRLLWDPAVFKAEKSRLLHAVAAARDEDAVRLLRSQGDEEGMLLADGLERELAALGQLEKAQAEAAAPAADRDDLLSRADAAVASLAGQGFAAGERAREIAATAKAAREADELEASQARARLRALLDGEAAGGAAAWAPAHELREELAWRWRRLRGSPALARLLKIGATLFGAAFLGAALLPWLRPFYDLFTLAWVGGWFLHFALGRFTPAGMRAGLLGFAAVTIAIMMAPAGAPGFGFAMAGAGTFLAFYFGGGRLLDRPGLLPLSTRRAFEEMIAALPSRADRRLASDLLFDDAARLRAARILEQDPAAARRLLGVLREIVTYFNMPRDVRESLVDAIAAAGNERALDVLWLVSPERAETLRRELAAREGLARALAEESVKPDALETLLAQARAASSQARAGGFAGGARADEIDKDVRALEAARAAGDEDAARVVAARLQDLVRGAPAGGAAAWALASDPGRAWRRFVAWLRLPLVGGGLQVSAAALPFAYGIRVLAPAVLGPLGGYLAGFVLILAPVACGALLAGRGARFGRFEWQAGAVSLTFGLILVAVSIPAGFPLGLALAPLVVGALLGGAFGGALSRDSRQGLLRRAERLPRPARLVAEGLAGWAYERPRALARIAGDRSLAKAFVQYLGSAYAAELFTRSDKPLVLLAIAAARDRQAVTTLRELGDPQALELAEGLEREVRAMEDLETLEQAAAAPVEEALIPRAEAAVARARAQGFAGKTRAEEIERTLTALRAAGAAGRADEAAQAGERLKQLIDGAAAAGAAAWTPADAPSELVWRARRLWRHPAARVVVPLAAAMLAASYFAAGANLFGPAIWLPAAMVAAFFLLLGYATLTLRGRRRFDLRVAGVLAGVMFTGLAGMIATFWPNGAFWGTAIVVAVAWAGLSDRAGSLGPQSNRFLRRQSARLPRTQQRLAEEIGGTFEERREALSRIAADPKLSHAMGGLLRSMLVTANVTPPADLDAVLEAVAAARDEQALAILEEHGGPRARQLIAAIEGERAGLAATEALLRQAQEPAAQDEGRALLERAETAAAAQGSGLAASLRAEAIRDDAARLKAALDAGAAEKAAFHASRLRELLDPSRSSAPGAASPRGSGSVGLWKALAHGAAALGLSWPVAASWLFMPTLAALAATAALAVYLVPLWAMRPTPAYAETHVVSDTIAARPAQEAAARLAARAGVPAQAMPRVGVLSDPNGTLKRLVTMAAGGPVRLALIEAGRLPEPKIDAALRERARRAEIYNARAFGAGPGAGGAIGVGAGILKEPAPVLEATLAHELGHVLHGDPDWIYFWKQRWSGPSARVAVAGLVVAAPACLFFGAPLALLGALAAAGLAGAGLAWLAGNQAVRAMERRADAFAVSLVGPEAFGALMRRLSAWGAGWSFDHDAPADRVDAARR